MKTRKLFATLLLVALLATCMSLGTLAAADGSITVDNATKDEVYTAYKVFDLTYTAPVAPATEPAVSYTYTATGASDAFLTALQSATAVFKVTQASGSTNVYNVKAASDTVTGDAIATWMKDNVSKLPAANKVSEKTATTTTVKWENLAYGYYYVTSSVGSLVTVDSTLKDVTIQDKNVLPTLDKKQAVGSGSYGDAAVSASIGDTISYEIAISNGTGSDKDFVVTDTLSDGLTNNKDYALYLNDTAHAIAAANYTKTAESAQGFEIKILASYVKTLATTDKILIHYTATLNENAVTSNTNTATLKYSKQTNITDTVTVNTYSFQIAKTDADGKLLTGAKFRLYDAATAGNEIKVVAEAGGYRIAKSGETGVEIEAGTPVIRGIATGTYYLEETAQPAGYNKLESRVQVVVGTADNLATCTATDYTSGGIRVINNVGKELPDTGGMGTTLFLSIGAGIILLAGIVLVTNKRMKKEMF